MHEHETAELNQDLLSITRRLDALEICDADQHIASHEIAIAGLTASLDHLISRVEITERRTLSNNRRLDHLTRSLDTLYTQVEKHHHTLSNELGDHHADLVKPDTR